MTSKQDDAGSGGDSVVLADIGVAGIEDNTKSYKSVSLFTTVTFVSVGGLVVDDVRQGIAVVAKR